LPVGEAAMACPEPVPPSRMLRTSAPHNLRMGPVSTGF